MFRSSRLARTALVCGLAMACSDGAGTTQPTTGTMTPGARKASPDVSIATSTVATEIFACYIPGKGAMYRIKTSDTPAECDRKDVQLSWTDRSGAIEGVVFAAASVTLPSDGRYIASCPDGKSVLNFGYEIPSNSTATTSQIIGNRPAISGGKATWGFHATAGTSYVFYWICAPMETVTTLS